MIAQLAQNLLVLVVCWVLTIGAGVYVTFFKQPEEIEEIARAEKVVELKRAEMSTLLAEAATSKEKADSALARWNARYKTFPDTLSSPDVVAYLNNLTRTGFEKFDITLSGITRRPDFKYYTYDIKGEAYFGSLYRFIWQVENSRRLLKISNLTLQHVDISDRDRKTQAETMKVMVSFTFSLEAYYGSRDGMSAEPGSMGNPDGFALRVADNGVPVPSTILPDARPAVNPFFPLILEKLPPNTRGLVDVETAELVGIVGHQAVFKDEKGLRKVPVGGAVYLGYVGSVDPELGRVVVHLNKGGIADQVELNLHTDGFRQALGPQRLTPTIR